MAKLPDNLVCWKCGAAIVDTPFPLGRTVTCRSCDAELHVCKMCEFFDTKLAHQCREPIAEIVNDKERANFCDYFNPKPGAYTAQDPNTAARTQLDALFGEAIEDADQASHTQTAEEIARQKLEDLFKK